MQTKAQKLKQKKAKDRQRKIKKQLNLSRNAPAKRYRLDVFLDGGWKIGIRQWSEAYQVRAHEVDTENRRAKGEEIAQGRVIDLKVGKVISEIPASKPKGMAPDKIEDGVKAADLDVVKGLDDFKVEVTPA